MATEDVNKLPKWAQRYIARLERDVETYKEQARTMDAGESDTRVDNWLDGNATSLPSGTRVQFNDDVAVMVERDGRVRVESAYVPGRGTRALKFRPMSSNVGYLGTEEL